MYVCESQLRMLNVLKSLKNFLKTTREFDKLKIIY